ncbi:MAG: hypothetical protein ACLFSQ_07225 [Candidatus Zixiibacteriota bacterium]
MFLGQILRYSGFCTGVDILEALDVQMSGDPRHIGAILLEMKKIDSEQLKQALEIQRSLKNKVKIEKN